MNKLSSAAALVFVLKRERVVATIEAAPSLLERIKGSVVFEFVENYHVTSPSTVRDFTACSLSTCIRQKTDVQ